MEDIYWQHLAIRINGKLQTMPNGCKEYTGQKTAAGYGLVSVKRPDGKHRMVSVHRALFMTVLKSWLPRDRYICYHCDNPVCANLQHLFLGTAHDNTMDMIKKGRNPKHYKKHTRERKFSNEVIGQIKLAKGRNADIAVKFGVSASYVSVLRSGKAKTLIEPEGFVKRFRNMPVRRY